MNTYVESKFTKHLGLVLLISGIVGLVCICIYELDQQERRLRAPTHVKAADRTFVFTDYEVPLKRMLDVDLEVVCYENGAQLSCVSIAPPGSLGDDKL